MTVRNAARTHVLDHFRWIEGDADTWSMLRDAEALSAITDGLSDTLRDERIDVVVGIEARGFVLGPLVALKLGVGFSPIRRAGALFPGKTASSMTAPDYRGKQHTLAIRADHFESGQRVALVDDWIETGSQAFTATQLVSETGATLVAIAVVIDEASAELKAKLPPVRALVRADELP